MPEEVSSVVLGDPSNFRAEHSESEPRMVFIKPLSSRSTETNVLITTVSGRSVSLRLVNDAKAGSEEQIDFVLNYEPERTLLVQPTVSTFLVPDSATKTSDTPKSGKPDQAAAVAFLGEYRSIGCDCVQRPEPRIIASRISQKFDDGRQIVLQGSWF